MASNVTKYPDVFLKIVPKKSSASLAKDDPYRKAIMGSTRGARA
jgi:hypothetical protein